MNNTINTLVVGGTSGIGKEIVMHLMHKKHPMPGTGRHIQVPSPAELDISDEWSIRRYVENFGPFDEICYTPGLARLEWAEDLTLPMFIKDYTVNTFGFTLLLGAHARMWRIDRRTHDEAPRSFSAVAMVSDSYKNAMRGSLIYCSSKAALASAIRCMAREWAPNCKVNGIAPAIVADTPMTDYIDATVPTFRHWDPEKAAAYEKSLLPMGRRITKPEVAQVFVNTLEGPAYLTGSIIEMSGGK